jgi:RNA polymerase sigma factor (sigma-70 family)
MVDNGFVDFVSEQSQQLLRLAMVLSRGQQDAEDLCQDALLRAYTNWSKVSAAKSPNAYVRRILVNEHLRRASGRIPEPAVAAERPTEEPGYLEVDGHAASVGLLAGLPAKQQAALALRYLEDRSYPEIAAALGCRESTARSLVRRGLRAIQDRSAPEDSGTERDQARRSAR